MGCLSKHYNHSFETGSGWLYTNFSYLLQSFNVYWLSILSYAELLHS